MNDELPKSNWKDHIMYRLGRRRAFLVQGDSMEPTLNNGEVVLVQPMAIYGVGDIILAEHPYRRNIKILKRIAQIDPDDSVQLIGDNPSNSTDSRTFGAVSIESIIGKVVCMFK